MRRVRRNQYRVFYSVALFAAWPTASRICKHVKTTGVFVDRKPYVIFWKHPDRLTIRETASQKRLKQLQSNKEKTTTKRAPQPPNYKLAKPQLQSFQLSSSIKGKREVLYFSGRPGGMHDLLCQQPLPIGSSPRTSQNLHTHTHTPPRTSRAWVERIA